ncbi:MAG TPA: DMT family protein [Bacteroidia bacterium]|nr:DMT family protein [Bacteroidia bacterium]
MKGLYTIILLILSNTFMTLAWYGHLRFKDISFFKNLGLMGTIFVSWGIALFEYMLMVPANRIGSKINGGPFDMWQLKIIQESISIIVFVIFTLIFFKTDQLRLNHIIGFAFLIAAIFFFFRK